MGSVPASTLMLVLIVHFENVQLRSLGLTMQSRIRKLMNLWSVLIVGTVIEKLLFVNANLVIMAEHVSDHTVPMTAVSTDDACL